MLEDLAKKHSDIAKLHVIGQSLEGRDIFALQINSDGRSLMEGQSTRPGAIFMGNHHAREHLSNEVPLMTAEYLLEHRDDPRISRLIDSRDLWFLPMVNPDGVEYDIEGTSYRSWRKNRRQNANGTFGVDLNRNYSYMWGTGGSSTNPSSDTYMGPTPFSEPETQAVRDFVANHLNATVLVSFHTFSELILYPWGHKYAPIEKERDLQVYRKMATTMSEWNGYTPQPSSDLYIASGDTTDWSYGTYGIFSFTFELSPKSMWQGGFYPGAGMIDRVFQDNLRPCLYLMELANDPYQVLNSGTPQWLQAPLATPISEDALKLSGSSRR
jgi:carboxypeptidase T